MIRTGVMAGLCAMALVAGCASPARDSSSSGATGRTLVPVELPDLSRTDEAVQAQGREQYAALSKMIADRGTASVDLAEAYGGMGMFLHAAEALDAAEPFYLNAQMLTPGDVRWVYYLAHLYKTRGETDKSAAAFRRALDLRPNDPATLIWLGRLYQELGRPEEAEPLFARALALAPDSVAALAGLGQAALARNDDSAAVRHLEQALAIDPEAAAIHSPLAQALHRLGDTQKAEAHLKQWRNREILVMDPLKEQLDIVLESGLAYELRGVRALEAENWTQAAELFRKGVALTPGHTSLGRSLRHKLGTALALGGDLRGAIEQFEEVVRLAPPAGLDEGTSKAHYSLGLLMASSGRGAQAIERFSAAIRYNPSYVEAHVALADALRRSGRVEASLAHYLEAVRISPREAYARFGYAIALVRLGRYRDARDWLTEAMRLHPDRPELANALVRVLAAAPDARVRDGERALALVQELFKGERTIELGETMAMTFAELGDFEEAVGIQRGIRDAARRAGLDDVARRLEENLRLYERRQPSRKPWSDDDPVHEPGPPVNPNGGRSG